MGIDHLAQLVGGPIAPAYLPSYSFNPSVLSFLSELPSTASYLSLQVWKDWYAASNPLHPALLFCAVISALVWIVGELTGNVSQVDRLWTFLPMAYSIHFTFFPKWSGTGEVDERMLLLLGLQALWSIRLTTNTYRRGFFNPSSEDYRWEIVRAKIPVWQFKIMNFFFIAIIQNMLLGAAQLPQYLLLTLTSTYSPSFTSPPLGMTDYVLSAIFVLVLCIEMQGDNEQQRYQAFKVEAKARLAKGGKLTAKEAGALKRGFVTSGLWSFTRHPNFACEQSTWYILYLFTIIPFIPLSRFTLSGLVTAVSSIESASDLLAIGKQLQGTVWNYSIWAPLTMSMLFYSSTDLTEKISEGKYPLYKQYQARVGMFWPPITTLKAIWLTITGRKSKVDNLVFGSAAAEKDL